MANAAVSPNFEFLRLHDDVLLKHAQFAERYVFRDPNAALTKTRLLAEILAKRVAAQVGLPCSDQDHFSSVEKSLRERGLLDNQLRQVMRNVRLAGNTAAHSLAGTKGEALFQLKLLRQLAIWFHKTLKPQHKIKFTSFVPPPNPEDADDSLKSELQQLRESLAEKEAELAGTKLKREELEKRVKDAEKKAEEAYLNEIAALELAEENEASLSKQLDEYKRKLEELANQQAKAPHKEKETIVAASRVAANEYDPDEFETRKLIDQQLREAGWEADTANLKHSKGARPQKNRNMAIAEWPTTSGPADYVLFIGELPVGTVEAKRKRRNSFSALKQAERYARDFVIEDSMRLPESPWDDFHLPFVFASNGTPFLRQMIEESGVWFRDARSNFNHARALTAWHTPQGLSELLEINAEEAMGKLERQSPDYLPLRYYQQDAIEAVESKIAEGHRNLLLAMATGTGKTRTCICLIYRLVKAKRFKRVLFVVDRTSLGNQASDAFNELKLEANRTFAEIYEIKQLGDLRPDASTRLQVATIQSMVKRVVDNENDVEPFPIDMYDCIIVDECHRGYILDQEMSEKELDYRNQEDFISKYRRVLDHFDAVKIGLTATPALHTTEIFGEPVYQYAFRQAVVDGFLVDQHPPFVIRTELSEKGLTWEKGQEIKTFDTFKKTITTSTAPDEIKIDIEGFNSKAITRPFNKVVCELLADRIPPVSPGKTLIFCVKDSHAQTVVALLNDALKSKYGPIDHRMVQKITGDVDDQHQLIREFKKEKFPKYAVTVDLLTTGIDVPEIVNLVFIRRTASRILYDQMVGRATRLCEDLDNQGTIKECFYIYDAVGLYESIQQYSDMNPVVTKPNNSFAKMLSYLNQSQYDDNLEDVREQIISKLNRKIPTIRKKWPETFQTLAGDDPQIVLERLRKMSTTELRDWFSQREALVKELDKMRPGSKVLISEEEDRLIGLVETKEVKSKPADYLESFAHYLQTNKDSIPALVLVTQRPKELTRQALRELEVKLRTDGYSVDKLRATNQNIAASIVGFVRHAMLKEPLEPFESRVDRAMDAILASQEWDGKQRLWLERIGRQLKSEVVLDPETLDQGQFKRDIGGFKGLNQIFGGKLKELLRQIIDSIWQTAT